MFCRPDETLDDLIIGGLKLLQPQKGYRFSIDAVLLAHFCSLDGVENAVDLGTGSGVIPLILSQRSKDVKLYGIEIQEEMADRARRSVIYNGLKARIEVVNGDIKNIKDFFPSGSAGLVTCNPPFFRKNEGNISKNREEAVARHEIEIDFDKIAEAAAYLLASKGKFAFIQRADRFLEGVKILEKYNMGISRVRWVHSRCNQPAKLVLAEGQKDKAANIKIMPPLIIYEESGEYSKELKEIYGR